jgi:hypothetical protein
VLELSLFTGAGGGILGTHLLGWTPIGYVEFNDYCQRVLAQRIKDGLIPHAPILGDVRDLDKAKVDFCASVWYRSQAILEDQSMPAHRKDYDLAVEMYEQGLSIGDIGDFYGITRQAMWAILKRRGVVFRSNKKQGADNHFWRGGCIASDRSQNILEQAIIKGIVQPLTHCENCGATGTMKDGRRKIQAHHCDYNKPLDVTWLCQECHHEWHKHNRAIPLKEDTVEAKGNIDVVSAGFP